MLTQHLPYYPLFGLTGVSHIQLLYPGKTHSCTERTCKLHAERQPRVRGGRAHQLCMRVQTTQVRCSCLLLLPPTLCQHFQVGFTAAASWACLVVQNIRIFTSAPIYTDLASAPAVLLVLHCTFSVQVINEDIKRIIYLLWWRIYFTKHK